MDRDEFNAMCKSLPATSHVVQWGDADVWKVGDKVFALCGWADGKDAYTFKVTEIAFNVLGDMPGVRPAPYLASRGMKWLQHYDAPGLSDAELIRHIKLSYQMIGKAMSKKKQNELGITEILSEMDAL